MDKRCVYRTFSLRRQQLDYLSQRAEQEGRSVSNMLQAIISLAMTAEQPTLVQTQAQPLEQPCAQ